MSQQLSIELRWWMFSVSREPTDFSPVERVDAAGGAVVHQSCFGSAEGNREREGEIKS